MLPRIQVLGVTLETFGMMFALALLSAGALVARRLREQGHPTDWAYELLAACSLGGLIGARGYYIVQNYAQVQHDVLGSVFSGSGLI